MKIVYVFFCFLGLINSAFADSVYPFSKNTTWTYSTSNSMDNNITKENKVIEHAKIKMNGFTFTGAIVERFDGTYRLIVRSKNQWIECGPIQTDPLEFDCHDPIVFFQWPLSQDKKWDSSYLAFMVINQESVKTPTKTYPQTWRISYTPKNDLQILGQIWFVEGVGPVRMKENNVDYHLTLFKLGKGNDLEPISDEVLKKILSSNTGIPISVPFLTPIHWFQKWRISELPILIMLGCILLITILGFSFLRALRTREQEKYFLERPTTREERKLLSVIATSGDLKQVQQRLQNMVDEHPNYPDLRLELALVQKTQGLLDEAKINLEQAVTLNHQYAEARLELGKLLLATGNFSESAIQLQEVVKTHTSFADAHFLLGQTLQQLGKKSEAIEAFENALKINPNFKDAKIMLSQCRKSTHP